MINFRYHLVSLTAIFLALGLGIAIGATVVDEALVDQVESQLDRVERRADTVDATNEGLERDLTNWDLFGEQAGDALTAGRLAGVPVALVSVEGVDGDVVGQLEGSLRAAGASIPFKVVLNSRLLLEDTATARELAAIVESASVQPDELRQQATALLAESWAGRARPNLLAELQAASFVEVVSDFPGPELPTVAEVAPRFLLVSSDEADLDNETLSVPLGVAMAGAGLPLTAADVSRERSAVESEQAPPEAPFATLLREEDRASSRISTVDHAADFRGRVAVILSLVQLGDGRFGHYGTAVGAQRLLPD